MGMLSARPLYEQVALMRLELDASECETLADALRSYLGDLSVEIANTDTREYREGLKAEREILNRILDRLRSSTET